ncbi:MAG: hypothetical protein ACR2P8_10370 [Myxococcota bacterium]
MATSDERSGTRRNDAEERIVAALKKIHARQQPGPGSAPPLRVVGSDPHADGQSELGEYDKARKLFSDLEQRLQKQYGIAEALVDRLREQQQPGEDSGAGASQQLLRLRARAGGVAGGRFVTANERARPARLELRPSRLRDARGDTAFSPRIELEPATLLLAPGEEQTVAISLDLAGSPFRAGETLELDVDVTEDGGVIHKLWVTIGLFES